VVISTQPNTVLADTVLINGFGYPITMEGSCNRSRIYANIENGPLGASSRSALRVGTGSNQLHLAPAMAGVAGSWAVGIELIGTPHSNVVIDATLVDSASCSAATVLINGKKQTSPGYKTNAGDNGQASDRGVCILGFL